MLDKWLGWRKRQPSSYSEFEVIDVKEINELSSEAKLYISRIFLNARIDPEYLKEMAELIGWQKVQGHIIEKGVPTLTRVKRGEFGETLICAMLEHFHKYKIPIFKLRFKQIGNETLHGTDVLALVIDSEGLISEVCYVESKLRTDNISKMTAVEGYNQLKSDYANRLPQTLSFISQRLFEQRHNGQMNALYNAFKSYMKDRTDTTDKDSFCLSLCWDSAMWHEKVLDNLQENGVELPKLTVHVVLIGNLRQVTDEIFAELGVTEVSDDD